jgi:uncharacterized protein YggE
MRRKLWLAICLLLIIIALGAIGCDGFTSITPQASSSKGLVPAQNTGIWVTGEGEISVTPDIATLEVGVEAQETTVAEAQAKTSTAMDDVIAALRDSGVTKEDIQTQYFRIRERTRWDETSGEEIVTGYRVTNKVMAKIKDIEKVGGIIDAVVKAGGNLIRIDGLDFSVDDPSIYYDEAREKAMADAKAKAKRLADAADVRLGEPTYISESAYMPSVYEGMIYAAEGIPVPAPAPVAVPPSISPGEVTVRLTVQVAYSIR